MKNTLTWDMEVSDLLINTDFLRMVKSFTNMYWINELFLDEKTNIFFSKFKDFKYKNENIEEIFTKWELLDNLGFIFSHEEILSNFLEYINYSNIDKKTLDLYLEVSDYLIKIYDNKDMYSDEINIVDNRLKDKIISIIWKSGIDNIHLSIAKNNFPTIWSKWFPIIKIDFDNIIDFYWDWNIDSIFVKVEDSDENIFYHNYKWDIFLTNDGKEIIDVKYLYHFKGYTILKVQTNDLLKSIEIRSKNWNVFDMPDLDDVLPWKIVDWENELEYLVLSKNQNWITKTSLFDIYGDSINLMNILRFINKWKESTIKMLELSLNKFNDIDVAFIKWIKTISWVKFIELSLDLNYDEEMMWKPELFNIIMMDSWKPLTDDNWEYIRHIFELESFWWKELLWFWFTPYSIDWFIDSTWTILSLNDELVHTIDDIKMKFHDKKMFKINDDIEIIISEWKVQTILNWLLWFNEIENENNENGFDLFFEEKDNFIFKNKKIDQVSCFNHEWNINILIYSNWVSDIVDYKEFISELKKDNKYKNLLKQINILIKESL